MLGDEGFASLAWLQQVLMADAVGHVARRLRTRFCLAFHAGRRQRIPSLLCPTWWCAGWRSLVFRGERAG